MEFWKLFKNISQGKKLVNTARRIKSATAKDFQDGAVELRTKHDKMFGGALGDSAQAFAAYGLVYAAVILKLILVDGGKDLFNPAGGYAWAAIFGGAGASALMQ